MGLPPDEEDDEDHGKFDEYDVDHEPFQSRHTLCKDWCQIPCLCVFLIAFLVPQTPFHMATFAWYGFKHGDIRKLHHGINANGSICGYSPDVATLPKLFFCGPEGVSNFTAPGSILDMALPVCVATCPRMQPGAAVGVYEPQKIDACKQARGSVAPYDTKDNLNICVPSTLHQNAGKAVDSRLSTFQDHLVRAMDSAAKGQMVYYVILPVAIVLGYLYMYFLQSYARCMVWGAVIIISLVSFSLGWMFIAESETIGTNKMLESFGEFSTTLTRIVGVACLAVAFGTLCMVCCCGHQIDDAIAAVEMTCEVLRHMPALLFAPILQGLIKVVVCIFLLWGFVHLISTADVKRSYGQLRTFDWTPEETMMIFVYILMFFWITCYITALYQFAMAYATAEYYFSAQHSGDDRNADKCAILEGYFKGFFCHTGSLAIGSFIIAIFAIIQWALEYIKKTNANNALVRFIVCILSCVCSCFKCCAEFINKNAYISMALTGYDFCTSTRKALAVMTQKFGAIFILASASHLFQIFGILLITALCGLISHCIIQLPGFADPSNSLFLPNPIVVVIISCAIGFAVAKVFMDVLDMVSATLVFCFAVDDNPNRMPERLKIAQEEVAMNNGDARYQ